LIFPLLFQICKDVKFIKAITFLQVLLEWPAYVLALALLGAARHISQPLSAKADSLRVKGTEAQRHRVFETHYFFFVPLPLYPFVP